MRTILVIGAGGSVGSVVLGELRNGGHQVRAAYHDPAAAQRDAGAGHDAIALDLSEPGTLTAALDGVGAVFLLSATGPEQAAQGLGVVRAAQAAGAERVVQLSVWRADEELTPIARQHRPVERALEASGLGWTFLRPNFYMQNFTRQMAASIRQDGSFAQPDSAAPISFVDNRDVALVAARVLTSAGHDGQVYDLTGPQALTYDQAAGVLSDVLGKPVRFTGLTDEAARAGMLQRGLPESYADALIEVSRAYRNGGAERVTPTVRDLTGSEPTSFAQFVRDHRAAFESMGAG
jgi:uncharacterized protein YbjT (DUF2867 family)